MPGPHPSIMACLNCGLDAAVAIPDDAARGAMRNLTAGVVTGETGAADLGGRVTTLTGSGAENRRWQLGVTKTMRVLPFSAEVTTDLAAYVSIVGG